MNEYGGWIPKSKYFAVCLGLEGPLTDFKKSDHFLQDILNVVMKPHCSLGLLNYESVKQTCFLWSH